MLGIAYPANALFIVAIGVAFVLLLHFSVAISRLSEETKILAQEDARLDRARLRAGQTHGGPAGQPTAPRDQLERRRRRAEQRQHHRPVGAQDQASARESAARPR